MRQHPIVMVLSKEAKAICSVVMGMETNTGARRSIVTGAISYSSDDQGP